MQSVTEQLELCYNLNMLEPAISSFIIIIYLYFITKTKIVKKKDVINKNTGSWLLKFFQVNSSLISTAGVFIAVLSFIYQPNSFYSLKEPYLQCLKIILWFLNILIIFLIIQVV